MKLHVITIGAPKLTYARQGWEEYAKRLGRYHQLRVTHLADKWAGDAGRILAAAGDATVVVLTIDGPQLSSAELAGFLDKHAVEGRELCCVIGGPDGLPAGVIARSSYRWSLSRLTFPHDLAMVVLAEALYRASTISAGHPYHRG